MNVVSRKTYDVSVAINPGSERSYTPGPADSYDYLSVVQSGIKPPKRLQVDTYYAQVINNSLVLRMNLLM